MFYYPVTDDITLKTLDMDDAEAMYRIIDSAREYLRQWLPWVDATRTIEDTKAYIQAALQQWFSASGFQAAILYRHELAGAIGFHKVDWINRQTSIGYWLAPHLQGRGIMTMSCRAMMDIAVLDYHLNRVEIQAAVANHKSRAIPERLGFQLDGIKRQAELLDDHFVDHAVYAMRSEDWLQVQR